MRNALSLSPLLLAGCTLFQPEPVIENRYFKALPDATSDAIALSVASGKASGGGGGIRITELSDRGQAALIAATGGKPPAELEDEKVGGSPAEVAIAATLSRRVEFSLRPRNFLPPGDRVDAIRVAIAVAPAQAPAWRITGWTQARNKDSVIEIGKLTDTSSSKISGSTGIGIAKFLSDTSVSAEASRELARELDVKDTGELNAAVDQSGTAWIDETAAWRVNLARNRNSIDVTLAALSGALRPQGVVVASKLWDDGAKGALPSPVAPTKVELRTVTRFVPRADRRPICGTATLTYRMRHIANAAARATFSESDDQVEFQTGKPESLVFQLSPSPHQPVYGLFAGGGALRMEEKTTGRAVDLQFANLEQASAFRSWLIRALPRGGEIANGTVGLQTAVGRIRPITAADLRALTAGPVDLDALNEAQRADVAGCGPQAPPAMTPAQN